MTPAEANAAILARWHEQWPAASGNIAYTTDGNVKPEGDAYFARVAIVSADSDQSSLGPPGRRRWEHEGVIEVRLSGPINEGRGPLDELAEKVRAIYQGKRIGRRGREHGVVTHAMSVAELRRDREAPHRWILTCSTAFEVTSRS